MQPSPPRNLAALLAVLSLALPVQGADPTQKPSVVAPLAPQSLLLDGHNTGSLLAAAGGRGHILTSLDGGQNWTQQHTPTRVTLTAIHFANDRRGWAAGHDATILRTADGGKTWAIVYQDIEGDRPILDLWFQNERFGIAVGAYGLYLVTHDGGDNWEEDLVNPDDDFHLNAIGPTDDGGLFIAGEAGVMYRAADRSGGGWQTLQGPYEGSYFGFQDLGGGVLLAYGLRGHLFRSEDGGENWDEIKTGVTAMLTDSVRLASGEVLIGGLGGTVLSSSDGGRTFTAAQLPGRKGIERLLATADGVIRIGEDGIHRLPESAWREGGGTP